jgi:ATP-dependent RNA helicase RhlE
LKTFEELDLIAPLQGALADKGYKVPTPIQAQTIPLALNGQDILGCAQTGTGKTAAFALPILNLLGKKDRKAKPNRPLALILAPTRELAIQIKDSLLTYGRGLRLRHTVVHGGVSQVNQVKALDRGVHVLVATPGRLLDLMQQGYIELNQLEVFVLDEADRMLDMGFLPDLKRIIKRLPENRQSMFFSATLPPKIIELSKQLLHSPKSVNVTPKSTCVSKIKQRVVYVEGADKHALLSKILNGSDVDRALVFTRTKRGADRLTERLLRVGVKAAAIHGNKSQNARQRALAAFQRRDVHVLVATDVASRGIDVDNVTHVVNFDLPSEAEDYVHRIGRTGRAGATGTAYTLCTRDELPTMKAIEKLIGNKVAIDKELQPKPGESREPRGERSHDSRQPARNGAKGAKGSRPVHGSRAAKGSKTSANREKPATPLAESSSDGAPKRKRRPPKRKSRVPQSS